MYDPFLAGCISGVFQTVFGHPFDTLKTWKQNEGLLKIPSRNFFNLYKGISMPLLQLPIICSVTFGVDNYTYFYTKNRLLSSGFSGFVASFIVCPLDYLKIQQQQQLNLKLNKKTFVNSFKDIKITMVREIPAYTLYFTSYNFLKEKKFESFISGGVAGCFTWFFTYPQDTIKSRLQSGQAKTIKEAYKIGGLWKGINYCLLRAFIVNAIGFPIFEYFTE